MLRNIAVLGCIGLLAGAMTVDAYAKEPVKRHRTHTRAMWSSANMGHLYLFEKDPATWEIVEDGAWGRLNYARTGPTFDFAFSGHGLVADSSYSLIYYPDPWPAYGLICLGEGVGDEFGNVRIRDSVDTGDLPADYDDNFDVGAKIWLVLSADVDCDGQLMGSWNPTEYLFENELIFFDSTARPSGPHHYGPPDQTKITFGLYERLEDDPADIRGSGELYGCAKAESWLDSILFVGTRLRFAVPETTFNVYVKLGDDHAGAQANPILAGEMYTDIDGGATADFEFDVSMFGGPDVYVQVVVEPMEASITLGYATDTAPVSLMTE